MTTESHALASSRLAFSPDDRILLESIKVNSDAAAWGIYLGAAETHDVVSIVPPGSKDGEAELYIAPAAGGGFLMIATVNDSEAFFPTLQAAFDAIMSPWLRVPLPV